MQVASESASVWDMSCLSTLQCCCSMVGCIGLAQGCTEVHTICGHLFSPADISPVLIRRFLIIILFRTHVNALQSLPVGWIPPPRYSWSHCYESWHVGVGSMCRVRVCAPDSVRLWMNESFSLHACAESCCLRGQLWWRHHSLALSLAVLVMCRTIMMCSWGPCGADHYPPALISTVPAAGQRHAAGKRMMP
jgi:hypothetical protein